MIGNEDRFATTAVNRWPKITLREANITLIDCDHRTPPASHVGYPYVAIPQLKQGRIDLTDVRRIASEHYRDWTLKAKPRANDVILSRRCNPGETAVVPPNLEFALGQNLVLLRADGTRVYPPFLRWLVRSPEWWEQIQKYLNVGAVFDSLKCADVPNFELSIPSLSIQRHIAHILGSLDDKIELNRQMNETLEAMARAIFKSWFVDFDPVRAKAEGRQPAGMDAATAALFPDGFEEIDGREVPMGWEVAMLGDVAENIRRPTTPHKVSPETPYIGLEHMPQHSIALNDCGLASDVESGKFGFRRNEFLFGKLRPYFHKVGIAPVDGVCSTDILVINPKKDSWYSYVICAISTDDFIEYTNLGSDGTKMPRTNWSTMEKFTISIPPKPIVNEFNSRISSVFEKIIANIHESRTLGQIRDALLPKLMCGEISLKTVDSSFDF